MGARIAVGIAAAIVVAAFLTARYLGWIAPQPGPLHAPGGKFGTRANGGSTVAAVFRLYETDADGTVQLLAAEAAGVDDALEVAAAQVLVCRTESLCVLSYVADRWPPNRTDTEPVEGYAVGDGTPTLVGVPVTVPEGPGRYRMRGIVVDYSIGSRRYRAEVGPHVVLVVPQSR